ncbi:adenylate kinase 9-like [Rhodnius prolixus]|uniref:adenylate kinase 9-like n=1 Tax=Rhodnius prolixus TaxID=13249 RepID=UPI003D18D9F8
MDSLLQDGYYNLSKFGRTCPVMLFENRIFGTGDIYHLVFRRHIYFIDSYESKNKFVDNPLKYICQSSYRIPPYMYALVEGYPLSSKENGWSLLISKSSKLKYVQF